MKYEVLYTKYKFTANEFNALKLIIHAKNEIDLEFKLNCMDIYAKHALYKMLMLFGGHQSANK